MARWMADFEVEGYVCVRDNNAKLHYVHAQPPFEVHIRNLKTDPGADPPLLSVQVIADADSARSAAEHAKTYLKLFIDTLVFVTNSKYAIRALLQVADWSPGLKERDCVQYQRFPAHDQPVPGLDQPLLETVAALHSAPVNPKMRRALKWFAHGVSEIYLDDQFQYFWFALEIVAEVTKNPARVPNLCQHCKTPLFCPTCKDTPTHRPFPKQAIQQLISKIVRNEPERAFDIFLKVRNGLLHGEEVVDIEASVGMPMAKIVDNMGHIAWTALLNAFTPSIAGKNVNFLKTKIYTHDTLSVGAVMKVGALGDPNDPQVDQLPKVQISMIVEERGNSSEHAHES